MSWNIRGGFWNRETFYIWTHIFDLISLIKLWLTDIKINSSLWGSIFYLNICCCASHFLSCGSGFKILAGVSRLIPSSSSHLSYFSMANALNGLPQLKSGLWMYFVHLLGEMLTLIFFARSEYLTLSFMCHSLIYHKNPKLNVNGEKKISHELY